jgi:hypothetical protein
MFKKQMNFRMRSGIASVAVLVCLTWVGIDFNASGESEFVEVKVALENAIAGSEGGPNTTCTVSHIPEENQGGCTANPYGGGMCVKSGPGPLCNGTRN